MKSITFPKEEIPNLINRKTIVTTRVDDEFNKYSVDDVVETPWGDLFKVTSIRTIKDVKNHPNYSALTQKQIELLSKYSKMNVIKIKKVLK